MIWKVRLTQNTSRTNRTSNKKLAQPWKCQEQKRQLSCEPRKNPHILWVAGNRLLWSLDAHWSKSILLLHINIAKAEEVKTWRAAIAMPNGAASLAPGTSVVVYENYICILHITAHKNMTLSNIIWAMLICILNSFEYFLINQYHILRTSSFSIPHAANTTCYEQHLLPYATNWMVPAYVWQFVARLND